MLLCHYLAAIPSPEYKPGITLLTYWDLKQNSISYSLFGCNGYLLLRRVLNTSCLFLAFLSSSTSLPGWIIRVIFVIKRR